MVEQKVIHLDNIFHALADPTRREMIRLLALQERTVTELAAPFDMSLAAASKHIKVLEEAGLLNRRIQGRTHLCSFNGATLAAAYRWMSFYERLWNEQFDVLEQKLGEQKLSKLDSGTEEDERRVNRTGNE